MKEQIAKWKETYVRHCAKYADSTTKVYWCAVECFLWHFNTASVDRIHWTKIADYCLEFDSARTVEQKKYAIQLFYSICIHQKNKLALFKTPPRQKIIPQVLNVEECFKVFLCIEKIKQRVAIQLGYACALRISELLNIQMKHIDFVSRHLFIENSKGAKDRKVPIPQDTLNLIRAYLADEFPNGYSADTFLFAGQKNFKGEDKEQYSASSVRAVLKRAVKKTGVLKKIKFHSLRHSRATHWHNAGMDIEDIAKLLGHNNIKTTQIYIQTGIEDLQTRTDEADELIMRKVSPELLSQFNQPKLPAPLS